MKPIKSLLLLALCMMLLTGSALAAKKEPPPQCPPSWMADIEAIAKHPEKIYEVYRGMPWKDFRAAWSDVPGWRILVDKGDYVEFEKEEDIDGVSQKFCVREGADKVSWSYVELSSKEKKIAMRIYNFARNQFTMSYGNRGQWNMEDEWKTDPIYPMGINWAKELGDYGVNSSMERRFGGFRDVSSKDRPQDRYSIRISSFALDIDSHRKHIIGQWWPDY